MSNSQICTVTVDGRQFPDSPGTPLIDFLTANHVELPHICYHPTLGPLEGCDTCWLEVNGELRRGCGLKTSEGLDITIDSEWARAARREGADRIVARHELYCSEHKKAPGFIGFYRLLHDQQLWQGLQPTLRGLEAFSDYLQKRPEKPAAEREQKASDKGSHDHDAR